jgi:sarcosine oxidase
MKRVLVAGLGAAGSATLYHLARAGVRAIGIDRWAPPHTRGSTHGPSRIHRRAYMEGPLYLPMLARADTLWEALEHDSGRPLLRRIGALMLGPEDGPVVPQSLRSASDGGVPVEALDRGELLRRYPSLNLPDGTVGLLEPGGGTLDPEGCVRAQLAGAAAAGAEIRTGEALLDWEPWAGGVRVRTGKATLEVDHLVVAAGPWLPELLRRWASGGRDAAGGDVVTSTLSVERQVTGHFAWRAPPAADLPVLVLDRGEDPLLYAIPETDGTLKAALHHGGARGADPDALVQEPNESDEARISAPLGRLLPGIASRWSKGAVCFYTNAPDHRWLVGPLPGVDGVTVVSACSGHGFKASSAIGEGAAALAMGVAPPVPLAPFALDGTVVIRRGLLFLSRSPAARAHLPRLPFAGRAVRRFMPGETMEAALEAGRELAEQGRRLGLHHPGRGRLDRSGGSTRWSPDTWR